MKKKLLGLLLATTLSLGTISPTMSFANDNKLNVTRIAGSNRYKTAVETSKKTFDKSKYAIIASGDGFADALVGGTLASQIEAPILLVNKNSVPSEVSSEIKRLDVEEVFLLGGNNTVSSNVENNLKKLGAEIERLAGKDRYETANKIALKRFELLDGSESPGDRIAAINGFNFADALSAAPFVGQLKTESTNIITALMPYKENIYPAMVFGGTNTVPNGNEEYRFAGSNRESTAVEVAKAYKEHLDKDIDTVVLVDGYNYPDALASAPVASMNNGAILLTNSKTLSRETKDYINSNKNIENIIIVGGENSVSSTIEKELKGEEITINNKFDILDKGLQAYLATNFVDSRVNEFRNLKGMYFLYNIDGDDLYTQLTSGVGSGHPIYHFKIKEDGISYLDGVTYLGIASGYEVLNYSDYPRITVSKDELYNEYLKHKNDYDLASKKIEKSDSIIKYYNDILKIAK